MEAIGDHSHLRFTNVTSPIGDAIRRIPMVGRYLKVPFSGVYWKELSRSVLHPDSSGSFDLALFMGSYWKVRIGDLPMISFAQGAPGSDARSFFDRAELIKELAGGFTLRRWQFLAQLRLSKIGLPPFRHSDRLIVGSSVSRGILNRDYGLPPEKTPALPYPIDLDLFQPIAEERPSGRLSVLWLGRIVPRKRLDLFLDACALAIDRGIPLEITIVGRCFYIPEFEKLIERFKYPEQLHRISHIPRNEVPRLINRHDVLCQPSDEENFGSSVAEAQACGLPVIVGQTNGNADYLCERDTHLKDDRPETLAAALEALWSRKQKDRLGDPQVSRRFAEATFSVGAVTDQLEEILEACSRTH